MKLGRIIESQSEAVTRRMTDNEEEFEFIEGLVELTKPPIPQTSHNYLIATPFRYKLPVPPQYAARFKPPLWSKNAFYASFEFETSAHEYGYHWLRQRIHLEGLSQQIEPRTHLTVEFDDINLIDLRNHENKAAIMSRTNYQASHEFVLQNPNTTSILYPSCRTPNDGTNIVTFEINTLSNEPLSSRPLHLLYDSRSKACRVMDPSRVQSEIIVFWEQVA